MNVAWSWIHQINPQSTPQIINQKPNHISITIQQKYKISMSHIFPFSDLIFFFSNSNLTSLFIKSPLAVRWLMLHKKIHKQANQQSLHNILKKIIFHSGWFSFFQVRPGKTVEMENFINESVGGWVLQCNGVKRLLNQLSWTTRKMW